MAESEGFEPPIPFQVRRFSRPMPSTTRPALRYFQNTTIGKPTRPGSYGLSASTLDVLLPASSRPAPLPAFAASSSESVPVLSAESTVPSESLTTSSAGSLFINPSGGVVPRANVPLISATSSMFDAEVRIAVQAGTNHSAQSQSLLHAVRSRQSSGPEWFRRRRNVRALLAALERTG
jgi:hypothetical protein